MAIDRKRLQTFRREIADLQNQLSFEEFYRVIRAKILDALARDDGRLFKELSISQQRRFIERLFKPGYEEFVKKIFSTYNATLDVVNDLYKDLGVDISRDFSKIRAIEEVNRQTLGVYTRSTVKDIQKVLRIGLTKGENFKQITRRLQTLDEKVVTFAETIARTQVKGYARLAKSEKARIAEVFFYEYTGIIRAVTRPFCRAMIGSTQDIDTISKMRNGNKEPVITYCGGWRCVHDWEPDPFAKVASAGEWQEVEFGGRTMKVFSEKSLASLVGEYEQRLRAARQEKPKSKKRNNERMR